MTRKLTKLNKDLQNVTRIMNKNIEDLAWRGDGMGRMKWLCSFELGRGCMNHITHEPKESAKLFELEPLSAILQVGYTGDY
ncbi:hypothetical protein BC936DRAFT_143442 [Jimgerdemannia flammicorona]|uniref:Uncharacterized protein n=1 Tax=Jimgerdemannia flammicorona TaxID=994334 RepID=A0A432ZYV3_9FUNG|nr:hypothetical protein BC936DRAFT_143442 [Jimgerdemannia flammicorona]